MRVPTGHRTDNADRINYEMNTEFAAIFTHFNMWFLLGWQDIKHRYKRSLLGPFWVTISSGIMVGCIGMIFAAIFRVPARDFLPYYAAGQIMWLFISGQLNDSCEIFIQHQSILKQISIPLSVHIMRSLWNNVILLFHNLIIIVIILVLAGRKGTWEMFAAVPAFIMITILLFLASVSLGIVCTRFRDIIQVIKMTLNLIYFITPILWKKSVLPDRYSWITNINPFSNMIESIREPLLGQSPDSAVWIHMTGYIAVAMIVSVLLLKKYRHRVAYWL